MSLWTIKKRWYSRHQWMMRRGVGLFLIGVMLFGPGFPFTAFASDTFVGDSAIYLGDPASRPRPKILFLIDNSQSTLSPASGSKYYPGVIYPQVAGDVKEPWDIYKAKMTGDGYLPAVDNDSYALEGLDSNACVNIIRTALLTTGIYAGAGTADAPNLSNQGGCDYATQGSVYALGNFLNYTQFVTNNDDDLDNVANDDDICAGHMDDFTTTVTYTELTAIYTTAGASMPGYLVADTDVRFYDMDKDGVPNGLFPGTPWEDGCDICPGYKDYEDYDLDGVPDGCDDDDDNDTVLDVDDICDGNDTIDVDDDGIPDDCDDLIDSDGDDVADSEDNCISIVNTDQANVDGDIYGDACDIDDDGDNVLDADDNCPLVANPLQENADKDPYVEGDDATGGDVCDTDDDNDGTPDTSDICPGFSDDVTIDVAPADGFPDNDLDKDGKPDGCDASVDSDGDGVANAVDNCPEESNPLQEDNDGDGEGDECDLNDDNDDFLDSADKCPLLADSDNTDSDGDGKGNPCDLDDDDDGILDQYDSCPLGKNTEDIDGDLIPDLCDTKTDSDGDGVEDSSDNCMEIINPNQADDDSDGLGNVCDPDDDNDGVTDSADKCHGENDQVDADKDGIPDACDGLLDDDKDGVPNAAPDQCPGPAGVALVPAYDDRIDVDKDSIPDCVDPIIDSDGDGIVDGADQCTGYNDNIDVDDDGTPDGCDDLIDSDGDLEPDNLDKCPNNDDHIDLDEDGLPDACDSLIDSDRDGVADAIDQCKGIVGDPLTSATDDRVDADLDGIPDCTGDLIDSDGDFVSDATDQCPGKDDRIDADDDGVPDGCDSFVDTDGDGVANALDQCPGALGVLDATTNDKVDDDNDNIPDCKDLLVDIDNDYVDDRFETAACIGKDDRIDVDNDSIADCDDLLIDSDGDNVADIADSCEGFDDNINSDSSTGDIVPDGCDRCPGFNDADDKDFDGFPDGCDKGSDSDGDGTNNFDDLCPGFDDKINSDGDAIPDGCDPFPLDTDNDGVDDSAPDKCPGHDDNIDIDRDGEPDGCDSLIDSDFDGIEDAKDSCPGFNDDVSLPGNDVDNDGLPDPCDPLIDSDRDGVDDKTDQCPGFADDIDADKDGVPDGCDGILDADFDGVADVDDKCPGKNDKVDVDQDNIPDCDDPLIDSDRDLVPDFLDQCAGPSGGPLTDAFDDRIDVDKDNIPDCADAIIDSDRDGVADATPDQCPGPAGVALVDAYDDRIDVDKDSVPDCKTGEVVDSDHDGVPDSAPDKCPGFDDNIDIDNDGTPDGCDDIVDTDKDGVADIVDQCPGKSDKIDIDNDGIPDGCDVLIDSDRDDVADGDDKCNGPVGGPITTEFDDRIDVDRDNIPDCSDPKIDSDHDGVADDIDNCPFTDSIDQTNTDGASETVGNKKGDVCDTDDDNDGVDDVDDNCPLSYGLPADQADLDGDGLGDICDPDDDNDNVADATDKCQGYPDNVDVDEDGRPDGCDDLIDSDGDLEPDITDKCPGKDDRIDVDGDGKPDGCDDFVDTDKDGVEDSVDNCISVPNASQQDTDYDGAGDACDGDDDGDGVADGSDNCPLSYGKSADQTNTDAASDDALGDVCDTDDDNDGVEDVDDNCPLSYELSDNQDDFDKDGLGDVCDPDIDGDDVTNDLDQCPGKNDNIDNEVDTDSDGTLDCGGWPNTHGDLCEGDDALGDIDSDRICDTCTPPYTEMVVEVADPNWRQADGAFIDDPSGKSTKYRLIKTHTSVDATTGTEAEAGDKPGWGFYWRTYWETVPDTTAVTGTWSANKTFYMPMEHPDCFAGISPLSLPVAKSEKLEDISPTWLLTLSQAMPTLSMAAASIMTVFSLTSEEAEAATQRSVIFDAINMVVSSAYNSAHFGAMTYGSEPEKGGKLIQDVQELSNQTEVDEWLRYLPGGEVMPGADDAEPTLNSGALRPQATALYDAGYYFGAEYTPVRIDAADRFSPLDGNCGYNHIILITNGLPNESTLGEMDNIIGDADGDGSDESTYAQGTHYSDDVAYYLNKSVDLTPDNKRNGKDITVHTVLAFAPDDELIERTAAMGGGDYYHAYNANELAEALNALLVKIVAEEDTAFVAPVVPASTTNRTISSDRVYLGLFKPQIDDAWVGNIKKYRVTEGTQLLDRDGLPATESDTGDFIEKSNSYWGTKGVDINGDPEYIVCSDGLKLYASGDGGLANCGGIGGSLAARDLLVEDSVDGPYTGARNIYTYPSSSNSKDLTAPLNRWPTYTTTNAISNDAISQAVLDVASAEEREKVLRFVQGFDIKSPDPDVQRGWMLGDILHSRPVVFNYSPYTVEQETDCNLNTSVVYVGANDGMLHAFRDCDGSEIWSFIPPQLLPHLKDSIDGTHQYFVDAPPVAYVHDQNNNGIIEASLDPTVDQAGDRVVLVFGLRRGGSSDDLAYNGPWGGYFAVDVSKPKKPVLLFSVDSSTEQPSGEFPLAEMGQSWSQPRLAKVNVGGLQKVVAFVTGGYDKYEDLRFGQTQEFPPLGVDTVVDSQVYDSGVISGIGATSDGGVAAGSSTFNRGGAMYAIEIATLTGTAPNLVPNTSGAGTVVWSYDHNGTDSTNQNTNLTYSIASDMTIGDLDNNGFADVIYVGDTGGRMWRFNVGNSDPAAWGGNIIFNANPGYQDFFDGGDPSQLTTPSENSNDVGRKLFYKPAVAIINKKAHLWFGSGDRAHPLNQAVVDRLYMVVDNGQTTDIGINEKNLVDLTDDPLQSSDYDVLNTLSKLKNLAVGPNNEPNFYHGWLIKMNYDNAEDSTSNVVGEKMLAAPVMFNSEVYFTTYVPLEDPSAGNPCAVGNLGTSYLYHLSARTGEAVFNYELTNDTEDLDVGDPALQEDGTVLKRADRVRTLGQGIPSGIVTLIDASGRVTMMISSSNRVETYNAPDVKLISPVYWMQW